jgi:hypothetical protein
MKKFYEIQDSIYGDGEGDVDGQDGTIVIF